MSIFLSKPKGGTSLHPDTNSSNLGKGIVPSPMSPSHHKQVCSSRSQSLEPCGEKQTLNSSRNLLAVSCSSLWQNKSWNNGALILMHSKKWASTDLKPSTNWSRDALHLLMIRCSHKTLTSTCFSWTVHRQLFIPSSSRKSVSSESPVANDSSDNDWI